MTIDSLDAICIYVLIKSIHERVSKLQKNFLMGDKNDRILNLKFSMLVQSAAFSTRALLEWQSSLLLLLRRPSDALVMI